MDLLKSLEDVEFEFDGDTAMLVWWTTPSGQVQPIIWPMHLHVHSHECFRA